MLKIVEITTLFNNLSPPRHLHVTVMPFWRVSAGCMLFCVRRYGDAEKTNCWIKSLLFLCAERCSRHFIKFRFNHWWQMDYFDDVFHTFLRLNSVIGSQWDSQKPLSVFIQNILNCVPKTNKAFRGLERHGVSAWHIFCLDFSFWGGVTL